MKYEEAQAELKRLLQDQQTVSIPKLRKLLQSLHISLNDGSVAAQPKVEVLKEKNGRQTVIAWNSGTYRLQIDGKDKTKHTIRRKKGQ